MGRIDVVATACTEHTEHAVEAGSGVVGRHFPDNNRWPEGLWEPCDAHMGDYVYCLSHVAPHSTGWCSVSNSRKIPLRATTREDAYAETRAKGLKIYREDDG